MVSKSTIRRLNREILGHQIVGGKKEYEIVTKYVFARVMKNRLINDKKNRLINDRPVKSSFLN